MSNKKIVDVNGKTSEPVKKKPGELNFEPHPNVIFAIPVDETKTKSGIIIPNQEKSPSPVCEIYAVGSNVTTVKEGDYVYIDSSYMRFAMIDNVKGVILMEDGIFGKVKE